MFSSFLIIKLGDKMKRINDIEKKQLGHLIHYYRNLYFRSQAKDKEEYKQVNFCKNICSQAQLSRLEHGEILKDQEIYDAFLKKLRLNLEKVSTKEYVLFETYFENVLTYQNDDDLVINYNEYVLLINKCQNIFKKHIIYTHYNYALEFILSILSHDIEEAKYIVSDVENNLDILPPKFLIITLHYLGIFYHLIDDYDKANKYYLLSIEHMHKNKINNAIVYIDIAYNYVKMNQCIYALDYISKALDVFIDTHNDEILESIYRCYGLINLKNKYYHDGLNFLTTALKYSQKTNKNHLIINNYNLLSVGLYLVNQVDKALNIINKALKIKKTERAMLIKYVIEHKLGQKDDIQLKNKDYQLIINLYQREEYKEEYFEKEIEPKLSHLSETINLFILNDMYQYYKENKKYKKALELLETYMT